MAGELVIVIGAPGSGKSTYLTKAYEAQEGPKSYVSSDQIRIELLGNVSDMSHNPLVMKVFRDRVDFAISNGDVVYVDATFSDGPLRREFVSRYAYKYYVMGYQMMTNLDDCLMRNKQRDAVVPDSVILNFYNKLLKDPPTLFEGFYELRAVIT